MSFVYFQNSAVSANCIGNLLYLGYNIFQFGGNITIYQKYQACNRKHTTCNITNYSSYMNQIKDF